MTTETRRQLKAQLATYADRLKTRAAYNVACEDVRKVSLTRLVKARRLMRMRREAMRLAEVRHDEVWG